MIAKTLFLTSEEYKPLGQVRQVKSYEWRIVQQQRCLVIVADSPIAYPDDSQTTTSVMYLNSRFVEQIDDFAELRYFPLYVHVSIPKVAEDRTVDSFEDLLHVAWAEIYDEYSDAKIHA